MKILGEEDDLAKIVHGYDIYRKSSSNWVRSDSAQVEDETIKRTLDLTLTRATHWRRRNGIEAFFPIMPVGAVLVTQSLSPTKKTTRDRIQKIVGEALKRANVEFDATYDGLTGLLNSHLLERRIKEVFEASASRGGSSPADAEIKPVASVGLIALDLDHFKQINDSYGHDYGDLVLKCFGHRLEKTLSSMQREFGPAINLEVGRSGGEEFLIVASGELQPQQYKEIAERIRTSVSEHELPTDAEWAILADPALNGILQLPHVSERRVTTSVGLSALRFRSSDNLTATITELRREADAALYRAKNGGRNTVRYFPEILDRFGTVIEHHQETDIVTIDIGSQVGVKVGQEFHVYHPDFTGEKAFVSSDGRSKKRLGTYPRFSSGRIVAFDVQQEISFCTIAGKTVERFPQGSILEQIPLGSIYHLVSPEAKASVVSAAQVEELNKYIETIASSGRRPIAAVFSIRNTLATERARGTAFVNRALAGLFEAVRQTFPLPAKVCQIESDKIAVAAQIDPKASFGQIIRKTIQDASTTMSHLVEFTVGVFTTGMNQKSPDGDQSKLDPKHALTYARYAAVSLLSDERQIVPFSARTASAVISYHRSKKTLADALVDYEALHKLGIEYSIFENQVALCAFELGNSDFALAHIQRAIALDPNYPLLKANLAYMQFALKQPLQAHDTFSHLHIEHPDYELDDVYIGSEALAAYAAYKKDPSSVDISSLKGMLENALPIAASGNTDGGERIRAAIKEIASRPVVAEPTLGPPSKEVQNLAEVWTKLIEAVGKVSPFTRSYLVNGMPVSFETGTFVIGFPEEFEDHLSLVDNARNQTLIKNKLHDLGHQANEIKFVKC